jgi:hypothetical protein
VIKRSAPSRNEKSSQSPTRSLSGSHSNVRRQPTASRILAFDTESVSLSAPAIAL